MSQSALAATSWDKASPEERGRIRETIHRRLTFHAAHTAQALHYACDLPEETVKRALDAMIKSGAIVKVPSKPRDLFAAVRGPKK